MAKKPILVVFTIVVVFAGLGLIRLAFSAEKQQAAGSAESPSERPSFDDFRDYKDYEKARFKWLRNADPEDVEKNVEELFTGRFYTSEPYIRIAYAIWKASPETLDRYEEAIRKHPCSQEAYGFPNWSIRMALEEIGRAGEPRVAISNPTVKAYVNEFFGTFRDFGPVARFDSDEVALKIISDGEVSKEETVKEYVTALKQHPWPQNEEERNLVWWTLEEVEKAGRPKSAVSPSIKQIVEEYFAERFDRDATRKLITEAYSTLEKSGEQGLKEWAVAVQQHRWSRGSGAACILDLLKHPEKLRNFHEKLQAWKMEPVEVSEIVRCNVDKFLKAALKASEEEQEELLDIIESEFDRHELLPQYLRVFEEHPLAKDNRLKNLMEDIWYFPLNASNIERVLHYGKLWRWSPGPATVRKDVEDFFNYLESQHKGTRGFAYARLMHKVVQFEDQRYHQIPTLPSINAYIKALREHPWPEDHESQQIIKKLLSELELLKRRAEGLEERRKIAKKEIDEFFEAVQSPSKDEREKASQKLLQSVAGPNKRPSYAVVRLYEDVIDEHPHPLPIGEGKDKGISASINLVWEKIYAMHWDSEALDRIWPGEGMPRVVQEDAAKFFKGIISGEPLERKEVILRVLIELRPYIHQTAPLEYMEAIQKHPWPEDEVTKKKIEMVLEVLRAKDDFYANRWSVVASPVGDADMVPDSAPTQSQRHAWAFGAAVQGKVDILYWPSIIKDENRPLMDRLWAAFYLARYYSLFSLCQGPLPPDIFEEEKLMYTAAAEAAKNWKPYVDGLLDSSDKTIRLLMHLGFASPWCLWSTDKKIHVPDILNGLENENMYVRFLAQDYLEKLTGEQFPLDPTDPAELRAPAIKQWQKWWEENKDKLHYDSMRRRLVQ